MKKIVLILMILMSFSSFSATNERVQDDTYEEEELYKVPVIGSCALYLNMKTKKTYWSCEKE